MTTILVVEDEAIVAIDITQRLKRGGYDVPAVAATGEAALRMIEELHPDLVLMDVLLKGEKDGIETAREIKNQFEIPVVFLTGQADESTQERVKNTGAYGFLLKPIDTASLLPTVELALARHAFEVQLMESEKRIRELTDALPEFVYETDATGAFSFVSASCLEMFGYTKEEFEAGLTVFDVIVTDDRDRGQKTFRRRMDATELGWVEYTGLRKDGSTIPISVSARPIHHDGVAIGTRGIAADNTQRKRSEERLRDSERRTREITDALPVVGSASVISRMRRSLSRSLSSERLRCVLSAAIPRVPIATPSWWIGLALTEMGIVLPSFRNPVYSTHPSSVASILRRKVF